MRVLILSDIHANPAALFAIREQYDLCLFLGDAVDYCMQPSPCIDWIRKHAHHCVRGNHDHGAAQRVYLQGANGFRYLTGVTRPRTIDAISEDDRRFLARQPTTKGLTIAGKRFFMVHATPRDPMDEYAPPDPEFWRKRIEGLEADVVCVGHTHVQFSLQVGNTLVINPGSVGLPRDGDPRAAYAIWTPEGVELKRVEYPVEETIASITESRLPDLAKSLLIDVLRSGKLEKKTA